MKTRKLGWTDLKLSTNGSYCVYAYAAGAAQRKVQQRTSSQSTCGGPQASRPHFQEPQFSANLELAEGLYPIAQKSGRTVAQPAIAWVLRRPEVTAAIVGARRPSQIEETVLAGEWVLSKEDISAIDRLIDKREKVLNLT